MDENEFRDFLAAQVDGLEREINALEARGELRRLRLQHVTSCINYIQVIHKNIII